MAYIPKEEWTVVGIVFDREAYSNDVARITTYIDGVKDGDSTLITMRGSTVGRANLTIGNLRVSFGVSNDEVLNENGGGCGLRLIKSL